LADTKKGRRPSFIKSANPELAENLYNLFIKELNKTNLIIKTGQFGAMMNIKLTNSGPATFILNSDF
jgi:D-tyrosyl-tRNA(Tyr) deacylase